MAVVTINDVLRRAEEFERMLADYYAKLSEQTTREGVRLLAGHMSRHRIRISEALSKLSSPQVRRIRSAPLRYEPQAADCRCFEGVDLPPGASAAEVLDVATVFDECLVRLYRQVLQQPVDEEAKELFESLVCAEQRDEVELKKIKAMDYF
jgi:rubrerythrin